MRSRCSQAVRDGAGIGEAGGQGGLGLPVSLCPCLLPGTQLSARQPPLGQGRPSRPGRGRRHHRRTWPVTERRSTQRAPGARPSGGRWPGRHSEAAPHSSAATPRTPAPRRAPASGGGADRAPGGARAPRAGAPTGPSAGRPAQAGVSSRRLTGRLIFKAGLRADAAVSVSVSWLRGTAAGEALSPEHLNPRM